MRGFFFATSPLRRQSQLITQRAGNIKSNLVASTSEGDKLAVGFSFLTARQNAEESLIVGRKPRSEEAKAPTPGRPRIRRSKKAPMGVYSGSRARDVNSRLLKKKGEFYEKISLHPANG